MNLSQLDAGLNATAQTLRRAAFSGVAQSAALSQPPIFGPNGFALTGGVANYGGQTALAFGLHKTTSGGRLPSFISVGVGLNPDGGDTLVRAGASIGW